MSDIDLDKLDALREELDGFAQPEKKGGRSAREERIIAGFEEIQRFVDQRGQPLQAAVRKSADGNREPSCLRTVSANVVPARLNCNAYIGLCRLNVGRGHPSARSTVSGFISVHERCRFGPPLPCISPPGAPGRRWWLDRISPPFRLHSGVKPL
jgi:hypothetical protein